MEKERMLSVNDLAETLNISRNTIIRWIAEGRIKALKFGRQWRFRASDISHWLEHGEGSVPEKETPKKRRFSLEGIIEDGQVDEKALDEVTKIWESRELQ